MRFFHGLVLPLVVAFFLNMAFIGCPPVSLFRLSTVADLEDLRTAKLPSEPPEYIQNMGFPHRPWNQGDERYSPNFHGITEGGRLVFAAPRFHNLAYSVVDPAGKRAELLIADGHKGHLQSYGWLEPISRPGHKANIAVKLDDDRYLLADEISVGGFSVVRAPWDLREPKAGKGELKDRIFRKEEFTKIGQPHSTPGIKLKYDGPVSEED